MFGDDDTVRHNGKRRPTARRRGDSQLPPRCSRTVCYHIPRTSMRLCVLLRSAKSTATNNNTLTIRTFLFSPPLSAQATAKDTHVRRVFASSFSTGPPGDRGALHCRWNVIATQPIRLVSFQASGILPVAEEQSRTRSSQIGGVEDQHQCRGLCHSSSPSARSLSRSPSPPPPSFTQSPSPPCSLVRDGQTSPHRSRLVFSRSTGPPLSPSPYANTFIIGTAVINTHTHTQRSAYDPES
jgi:hypothetical protein